jgi:hypothetical protein
MADESEDKLGRLLRASVPPLSDADAEAQRARFEDEYQQRLAAGTVPEYEPPRRPSVARRAASTARAWLPW